MSETPDSAVWMEELQLSTRDHGVPLEALRHPITRVGLHYPLIHYDIPDLDDSSWQLRVRGEVDHELNGDRGTRSRPAARAAGC